MEQFHSLTHPHVRLDKASFASPVHLISEKRDVPWIPLGGVLRCLRTTELPPLHLTTCTIAFCFQGEKLLFVKDEERGWDIPGGHIEPGEDILTAFHRELKEEAYAVAHRPQHFARYEVEIANPPAGYKYPSPRSFMACFLTNEITLLPFEKEFETTERRFYTPDEVRALPWGERNLALFETALQLAKRMARPIVFE